MRRGDDGHARVGHARDVRAFFFSMTRMRRVGLPVLEETCNGVARRGRYAHKPPMQGAISSKGIFCHVDLPVITKKNKIC